MSSIAAIDYAPDSPRRMLSKVPQVTFLFWIIKILATTFGETGGDALSMQFGLGYALSSLVFFVFLAVAVAGQVTARKYHPFLYWAVVIATTTMGTTTSDYLDRTAGLGYPLASLLLFSILIGVIITWRLTLGRVEFQHIVSPSHEYFYWLTILISNTLGTALGDYTADDLGFGFQHGSIFFFGLILVVLLLYATTRINRSYLFWAAYILTRPLGATLGDSLTKPHEDGGLNLSRIDCTLLIGALMVVGIVLMTYVWPHRPEVEAIPDRPD
ncbi:MAG: COG4705 family protein [Tepidisphaeraceae bacterium]